MTGGSHIANIVALATRHIQEDHLDTINYEIMSNEYQEDDKIQVTEFNKYFEEVSEYLYGEKYLLEYFTKKMTPFHLFDDVVI